MMKWERKLFIVEKERERMFFEKDAPIFENELKSQKLFFSDGSLYSWDMKKIYYQQMEFRFNFFVVVIFWIHAYIL